MINIRQSGGGGIGSYIVVAKQIKDDLYEFEGDYVKMVTAFVNAEDVYLAVQEGDISYCISLDGTYKGNAIMRDEIQCEDVTFSGLYVTDDAFYSFDLSCAPNDRHKIMMKKSLATQAAVQSVGDGVVVEDSPSVDVEAPKDDGKYVLSAEVKNGVPTYRWVKQ